VGSFGDSIEYLPKRRSEALATNVRHRSNRSSRRHELLELCGPRQISRADKTHGRQRSGRMLGDASRVRTVIVGAVKDRLIPKIEMVVDLNVTEARFPALFQSGRYAAIRWKAQCMLSAEHDGEVRTHGHAKALCRRRLDLLGRVGRKDVAVAEIH